MPVRWECKSAANQIRPSHVHVEFVSPWSKDPPRAQRPLDQPSMQACWHACRHRCSVLLDRHHTSQSKKRRRRNLLSVLVEEGTSLAHCLSGTVPSAEATVMDPRDADQQAAAADYSGSHALPPPSPATIAAPLRISVPGRVSAGAFGPLRAQALGVSSPLPFTPIATPPTPLAHLAPATPISVESSPEPPPYARLHARNVPPRDLHALPAGLQHSIGGGAHRFHGDDGSDDESANEDEDEDDNLLGVSHGSQPGTGPLASFVESLRRSLLHALPAPASAAFYRWCQSRRGYRRRLVTLLLLLLAVSLVIYICAVASTCASSGGCRAWPFGHHAPPPHVPFTIISLLRDMSEETLLKDKVHSQASSCTQTRCQRSDPVRQSTHFRLVSSLLSSSVSICDPMERDDLVVARGSRESDFDLHGL